MFGAKLQNYLSLAAQLQSLLSEHKTEWVVGQGCSQEIIKTCECEVTPGLSQHQAEYNLRPSGGMEILTFMYIALWGLKRLIFLFIKNQYLAKIWEDFFSKRSWIAEDLIKDPGQRASKTGISYVPEPCHFLSFARSGPGTVMMWPSDLFTPFTPPVGGVEIVWLSKSSNAQCF